MDLAEVTEGATTLLVPRAHAEREGARGREVAGPAEAGPAFYNPAMALTRDIGVLVAGAHRPDRGASLLDGLAATGARGLRAAHEAPGWQLTLNDRNPDAVAVARANVKVLGLERDVDVHQRELNALLAEHVWYWVEVDPYGSPVPFLSQAVRAVKNTGMLGLSATDTTALHGTRPEVCRRRYLAEPPPRRSPGWKAAAARLFIGHVVRVAAQFDLAATPLLVHEHQHALRAYVRVRRGAGRADAALARLGHVVLCPSCQTWGPDACACGQGRPSGPYELGPLQDHAFVEALQGQQRQASLARPDDVAHLLDRLAGEAGKGPFYLDVDEACRARKLSPPSRQALLDGFEAAGIEAAPTHFTPTGIAYTGEPAAALGVLQEAAKGA